MFVSRNNISFSILLISLGIIGSSFHSVDINPVQEEDTPSKYVAAVQTFADNVLKYGRDTYGSKHSPLFVDGIHSRTYEPVKWETEEHTWVISNFGSQQNLMRVFVGLSGITENPRYRNAAEEAAQYMFDHHADANGLLRWGGHQFVDLETMEPQFQDRPHELKNNYPFYEFMWEVDSASTRNMLRAIWNAHILDWSTLDLNRHGEYDMEMGKLWDHEFSEPKPFFESEGLTFINAGTDMIQAALTLYALGEEEGAQKWGMRLYEQYVKARHPETGLGVYQYSRPKQTEEPPAEGPLTGELTFSKYGDRAQNQFGSKYGDVALEGNVLWGGRMHTLYGKSPVMLLYLAEQLQGTKAGKKLLEGTISGLKAYGEHAYVPEENLFKPMWADGTDLTGQTYPRTGYYGSKGRSFRPVQPSGEMLLALAKAVRLTDGDPVLWQMVRHQMKGAGLGDPGQAWNGVSELNMATTRTDPKLLAALLEIYKGTKHPEFLEQAKVIGDNILEQKFYDGFFIPSPKHKYIRFDTPEPLVLLMLDEALQGAENMVPPYLTSDGSTDGEPTIHGRPSDEDLYRETFN